MRELVDADSASLPLTTPCTGGDASQLSQIVFRGNRVVHRRRGKRGTDSEKEKRRNARRSHASKQNCPVDDVLWTMEKSRHGGSAAPNTSEEQGQGPA